MKKKIDTLEMLKSIVKAEKMFGRLEKKFHLDKENDNNVLSCKLYLYGQCVAIVKQDGEITYLIAKH